MLLRWLGFASPDGLMAGQTLLTRDRTLSGRPRKRNLSKKTVNSEEGAWEGQINTGTGGPRVDLEKYMAC